MTPHERFVKEVQEEGVLHGVRVTSKNEMPRFWRAIDIALKILSLGRNKTFLTNYTTTLGKTIYFPVGWDLEKANNADYITFRHELIHVKQFEELSGGVDWLGMFVFGLLYLLLPLPIGFAWFRYDFERQAYLEGMRVARSLGYEPDIEYAVNLLSGPAYLWSWPFKKHVHSWFIKKLGSK